MIVVFKVLGDKIRVFGLSEETPPEKKYGEKPVEKSPTAVFFIFYQKTEKPPKKTSPGEKHGKGVFSEIILLKKIPRGKKNLAFWALILTVKTDH